MNNPKEIKELLTPISVAKYYLGQPVREQTNRIWYKSPFRNERTASFMVTNNELHDFGDGWHGDIISFVEKFYNTSFVNAMKILTKDFGLPDNEKVSEEFAHYIKQCREEERQLKRNLDKWFYATLVRLIDELHKWTRIKKYVFGDALVITIDKEQYLEYLVDEFINANEKQKIELWKERKDIEKYLS